MKRILVTGGAGFIGSNLVEKLLDLNHYVICLDNLSTGNLINIEEFKENSNFKFVEGDILDYKLLSNITKEIDVISHQAALGSVPRSINDPITSNRVNVEGTLNVFKAAVENRIEKVVYAASSSTYGDLNELPKVEGRIGNPISPYAVTKLANELYARVFKSTYDLNTIGLRYFNVFGPKQNPKGPYAAVIPLFLNSIINNKSITINGDGETSRDFTFVDNAVQANILAINAKESACNEIFNIAYGERTSLNDLIKYLSQITGKDIKPNYGPERNGDVKHSLADISKAKKLLNYSPEFGIREGLKETYNWYERFNHT